MYTVEQLEHLVKLLKSVSADAVIAVDPNLSEGDLTLEPITVSCQDSTIVGYVITNASIRH